MNTEIYGTRIMNPMQIATMDTTAGLPKERKEIVIYHANCADGFAAAWCFHDYAPEKYEFVAASYNDAPPDCTNAIVYLVDFSYKLEVVQGICDAAAKVVWIDHHVSALQNLQPLWANPASEDYRDNFEYSYSVSKSGARLAWEYLHTGLVEPPLLLQHIEDRDLWKFEMEGSREIAAALFSYDWTFPLFDDLMHGHHMLLLLKNEGAALERKHMKDVVGLIDMGMKLTTIDGYIVPTLNVPHMFASDAGNLMATNYGQGKMFAATYMDTPKGRTFSLRSAKNGLDVSKIAEKFGGGGHKNAAGFTVQL